MTNDDETHLRHALRLAEQSARNGGGPFGAVIVRGAEVVAVGANCVVSCNDPTAHAEVSAIRAACEQLESHELEGCVIYSSCEPCPMCLGAIHWARLGRLVFAGSRHDAADAGFDDALLYEELPKEPAQRALHTEQMLAEEGRAPFAAWAENDERAPY